MGDPGEAGGTVDSPRARMTGGLVRPTRIVPATNNERHRTAMRPTGLHGYLPSRQGQLYTWTIVYEPRDWWIGLYRDPDDKKKLNLSRIFVCAVPCFPIIVTRLKKPGPPYPTVGADGTTTAHPMPEARVSR